MKTRFFAIGLVLVLLNSPARSQAPETGQGYNAFRLLRARNIFDPERRSLKPDSQPRPQAPVGTRAPFAALTGTMVTDSKALAFFSGSQPDYNKVLGTGETIANAKIVRITRTGVEFQRDGNPIVIAVGQQLPLAGSEAVPASAAAQDPAAQNSTTISSSSPNPPTAPDAGSQSEVLKRMMERRRQETSK